VKLRKGLKNSPKITRHYVRCLGTSIFAPVYRWYSMRLYISALVIQVFSFQAQAESYKPFEQNGKIGLKNESGQVVIPPQYEALGWSNGSFSMNGNVTGYKLNGAWGVVNLNNQRLTPPNYSSLSPTDGNLMVAGKQSAVLQIKTGCIDTEGKTVIPFMYAGVKVHAMRVVAFIREGNRFKHGLVDFDNKILIPFLYRNIYPIGSLRYAVEDFNGKTALFSDRGRQISGFTIDSISQFQNNLAIIYEAGKQGLINREGQLRSEAKYREIDFQEKSFRVRMPDKWGILTSDNKLIETVEADSISLLEDGQYKIQIAGRSWIANADFKKMHAEGFSSIGAFRNGYATFSAGTQYGVIRKNSSIVLPAEYLKVIIGETYFLTLERNIDKLSWSLRDTTGLKKNQKPYDRMLPKMGAIFPVKKNGYWGAINETGNEIVACVYDSLLESQGNQVAVKFKGQYGIISLKEEWLAFPQPNPVQLLNQNRYFKIQGRTIFLCAFTGTILYFTTNPIEVKENYFIEFVSTGGTWTLDFDGRIVGRQLPPVAPAEEIFPASEGLRGIKKNGKYGFIDDQGRLRIANRYEAIKPFSEGHAAVKIRNKWGFINRDEKLVIQPVHDDATSFEKGYSQVRQAGKHGLINKEGKLLLPVRYSTFIVQENGRIEIGLEGLKGLADAQGNILLQPKYQSIQDLNNGFIIIQQHGKYGLTTLQGVSTIPLIYDALSYDKSKNRYLVLIKSEWVEMGYGL
jgi:hypothetical protein